MMTNPHNPEKTLWNQYLAEMNEFVKNPDRKTAKENADYYYDQWEKVCEKRVRAELQDKKIPLKG